MLWPPNFACSNIFLFVKTFGKFHVSTIYHSWNKFINPTSQFSNNFQAKLGTAQKMKFSLKNLFSKCDQILNGKPHFLCSVVNLNYSYICWVTIQRNDIKMKVLPVIYGHERNYKRRFFNWNVISQDQATKLKNLLFKLLGGP